MRNSNIDQSGCRVCSLTVVNDHVYRRGEKLACQVVPYKIELSITINLNFKNMTIGVIKVEINIFYT